VSRKWRNWYQSDVDEETMGADSRDRVKHLVTFDLCLAVRLYCVWIT